VEQLETAVEVAAEEHARATEDLSRLVAAEIRADGDLQRAREGGARERGQAGRRARAVYMAGGQFGLVAGVLDGEDPGDVLDRFRVVQVLVRTDAGEATQAADLVDQGVTASTEVQQLRARRQLLEAHAAEAAREAETALARHRALLAQADARVVELAAERRRQEEQVALLAAASTVTGLGALPDTPAPTAQAAAAIAAARTMLGRPYQWGAVGPGTFDCSGLTSWAYRQADVVIPRTSRDQFAGLPQVRPDQLAPGDLVFYASGSAPSSIHHVGLYVGDGLMIHAPRTGDVVKVSAVATSRVYGVVRPSAG
jgi:cell wall-associated NlpC family hydrolase